MRLLTGRCMDAVASPRDLTAVAAAASPVLNQQTVVTVYNFLPAPFPPQTLPNEPPLKKKKKKMLWSTLNLYERHVRILVTQTQGCWL